MANESTEPGLVLEQAYYTSCEVGLRGSKGFQMNAVSPGLDPNTLLYLERYGVYVPPLSSPTRPTEEELGSFPKRAARSAREIILAPLGTERGAKAADLREIFNRASTPGGAEIATAASIGAAVKMARRMIRKGDSLLVFGSHLTIEEATRHL